MAESSNVVAAPTRSSVKKLNEVKTVDELFQHPMFRDRIADACVSGIKPDRLFSTFRLATQKNTKLLKVNPLSLMGSFVTCAAVGLEPNTPLQEVHLIPFDVNKWDPKTRQSVYIRTDVNVVFGYPGYLKLAYRSGQLKSLHCDVVWADDEFSYEYGSNEHLFHKPKGGAHSDGDIPRYAYMYAKLVSGGEVFEVMPAADVLQNRSRSQSYLSAIAAKEKAEQQGWKIPATYTEAPWVKYPIPMWRKTALRAGQKWLPKSAEMAAVSSLDEAHDRGVVDMSKVIDGDALLSGAWEVDGDGQDQPSDDAGTHTGFSTQESRASAVVQPQSATVAELTNERRPTPEPVRERFSEFLVDAFGDPAIDDPITDPLEFATQFSQLAAASGADLDGLADQNMDALRRAGEYDPRAAAVIKAVTGAQEPDKPAWVVPVPLGRQGKPDVDRYIAAVSQALAGVGKDDRERWFTDNAAAPGFASVPGSARLKVAALASEGLDKRLMPPRKAEPADEVKPADPAPQQESEDAEAKMAAGMVHDLSQMIGREQLIAWGNNTAIVTRIKRWEADRRDLFEMVVAAKNKRAEELKPKPRQPQGEGA